MQILVDADAFPRPARDVLFRAVERLQEVDAGAAGEFAHRALRPRTRTASAMVLIWPGVPVTACGMYFGCGRLGHLAVSGGTG